MNHRHRAARYRIKRLTFVRPRLEELESRLTLSFNPGATVSLELVALHEFGHAIGLQHVTSAPSIMNPDYNPEYSISSFLNGDDPAVADVQALYSGDNIAQGLSPWRDAIDANPGNNTIDLTYSFAGGEGLSSFVTLMNQRFGDPGAWQPIFARVAEYWSMASGGTLTISFVDDEALPSGFRGNIRLGATPIDGEGGVLAIGAEPPSGEITFDADEAWGADGGAKARFLDDAPPRFQGEEGGGEALMGPVINLPRHFIAIMEAGRELQVTVFSDLNPVRVIQIQLDTPAPIRQTTPTLIANVGWGQHSQADLYKVVFLPVLPIEDAEPVVSDAVSPQQPGAETRPDPTAPVRNDPSVQTQTLQLPPQSSETSPTQEEDGEVAFSTVFDGGTALAGLALFLGGYWSVPQEENRKRTFGS